MGIGAVMSIEVVYCDSCGRRAAMKYLDEANRPLWYLGKNGDVDTDTNGCASAAMSLNSK
jgi:hypothetical protein